MNQNLAGGTINYVLDMSSQTGLRVVRVNPLWQSQTSRKSRWYLAAGVAHGMYFLLLLLTSCLIVEGIATESHIEPLQQIPQLSYGQLVLIASNATVRCNVMPQLCNWQLHLYDGHAFSVELPQHVATSTASTITKESTTTTTSTTKAPKIEPQLAPLIFAVPGLDNPQKLLIYAQVEREPRPKRGRSRRRRPEKKVPAVAQLKELT